MPSDFDIICLLDDEPSVLKALGRLLASEGLRSQKFSESAHFLDHARSHPMRLAIIDIRMPGMTGLEVMVKLRVCLPEVRVILMTGENDPDYQNAAMVGGADAFFFKPFDDEAFLQAIREAIESPA